MKKKKKDTLPSHEELLEFYRSHAENQPLTTNQGLKISDNQNTLKAGERGPSLLEDFIMREKITHFDHERIPERIVHARGEAAHGYFQVYRSLEEYTKAGFLQDPQIRTPVFVRFSTVAGSRGSSDTVRDARGFAVKFYTGEGVFDLVGNNIPVFFIQDAIKFPDLIHAVKPEPHNEIPQAASAHDTFWDFVSLQPETMHMIMWVMSDRAIPRSLAMMEGFGVHTFRFINQKGKSHFVKFHWKPLAGLASLLWDEAQQISGRDPDFHRRDLWESIERGQYPEWELGVQIIPEADEHRFPFDLLDATKLIPEELVPVQRVGKLVLNRNPDNFFAETEQVAFHPGHLVPGIDFTNDPLLQGRLFSYTDTQISRLGGVNFHELPINRGGCPFHNNQRDGMHRQTIHVGQTAYEPNSLSAGFPKETAVKDGGFATYPEKISGEKIRKRSDSFNDHFSQATLFWNSQTEIEKQHIIEAFQFELGKVTKVHIRKNLISHLNRINSDLAEGVASGLGLSTEPVHAPKPSSSTKKNRTIKESSALSIHKNTVHSLQRRKVAIVAEPGSDLAAIVKMRKALVEAGASVEIISSTIKVLGQYKGQTITAEHSCKTMPAVVFDAAFIPGGITGNQALQTNPDVSEFIQMIYKHLKPLAAQEEGVETLQQCLPQIGEQSETTGVITTKENSDNIGFIDKFKHAIGAYRCWKRMTSQHRDI